MATHQERPIFTNYKPLNEEGGEDLQDYDDVDVVSSNGCGCFRLFGFGFNRNSNKEGRNLLQQHVKEESWMVKKLKKVKEVSEMVAGPKWKTFIRKMGGYLKGKKQKNNRFQYDPESYALNFDEREEEDGPPIGFSARFAVPTASALASKEQG